MERANARASVVLPVPGTSSNSTCPPASSAASIRSIGSAAPTTTEATFARMRSAAS